MGFFDKLKKINIFAGFGSELTDDFYDELEEQFYRWWWSCPPRLPQ